MFSKVLIRLIDQSVVPAIALLAVRIISIVLLSNHYGYTYTLDLTGFYFRNPEEYILLNSYSTFIMAIFLIIGLSYVLIKALAFHDSHIHPTTTARLFSIKMNYLIQDTFCLYTQGSIWLSYLFLLAAVSGLMVLGGIMYAWVFYVVLAVTLVMTVLFILDVEHEIAINNNAFEEEGYVEIED